MTTVKPTPTLPPSWSPTVAGCLSTSDFWQWDYGSKEDARTVLGGPSQTTNCLPISWASNVTYSGSECPLYYTSACQGNDSFSAVTCCPSLYSFECKSTVLAENHGSHFQCVSAWASSGPVPVTHTNFLGNTLAVETQVAQTTLHLFALAIIYVTSTSEVSTTSITASNDPTTTSQTEVPAPTSESASQSTPDSNSSNSGISTGDSAGIGVGAAAGAVLLAVVAWWVYRRMKLGRQLSKPNTDGPSQAPEMAGQEISNDGHKGREAVPLSRSEMPGSSPATQELPAYPQ